LATKYFGYLDPETFAEEFGFNHIHIILDGFFMLRGCFFGIYLGKSAEGLAI